MKPQDCFSKSGLNKWAKVDCHLWMAGCPRGTVYLAREPPLCFLLGQTEEPVQEQPVSWTLPVVLVARHSPQRTGLQGPSPVLASLQPDWLF